jgi:ABC-type polysaccharide/polyol phosphate transport system ATPase subunit
MEEFRDHGATIILVSHNMETILEMCRRAVWLDHGQIRMVGNTDQVVPAYQEDQTPENVPENQ